MFLYIYFSEIVLLFLIDVLHALKKRISKFRHVNDRQAEKHEIHGDHPQFNLLNFDEEHAYATQWEELTVKALSASNENDFTPFNGRTKIKDKSTMSMKLL